MLLAVSCHRNTFMKREHVTLTIHIFTNKAAEGGELSINVNLRNDENHAIYILKSQLDEFCLQFYDAENGMEIEKEIVRIPDLSLTVDPDDICVLPPNCAYSKKFIGKIKYDRDRKLHVINFDWYDLPTKAHKLKIFARYNINKAQVEKIKDDLEIDIFNEELKSAAAIFILSPIK
jgi:hypothetical protein